MVGDQPRRRWRFYRTAARTMPVCDFLTAPSLPSDDRDEIPAARRTRRSTVCRSPATSAAIIYEVRASGARATYRILFATEGSRRQVLLAVSAFSRGVDCTDLLGTARRAEVAAQHVLVTRGLAGRHRDEIGRASCREGV